MEIVETGDAYRVYFYPDARDGPTKDLWEEKGYRIQLGIGNNGEYVPKFADYDKTAFSLDDVAFYAKNIKECKLCTSLNNEIATLKRIQLSDIEEEAPIQKEEEKMTPEEVKKYIKQAIAEMTSVKEEGRKDKVSNLFQDIALDFFKSQFTEPGLVMLSILLDDQSFIEGILPEEPTEEDILSLRAMIWDYLVGNIPMLRSSEEVRGYAQGLRMATGGVIDTTPTEAGLSDRVDERLKKIDSQIIFAYV